MGDGSLSDPQLPQDDARLAELSTRIDKLRRAKEEPNHMKKDYSQAQLAWRMVIELVAGLVIGFGIGYGLDTLLGTIPIFMVLIGMATRAVQQRQWASLQTMAGAFLDLVGGLATLKIFGRAEPPSGRSLHAR